jgi:hypothetical protein
MDNTLAFGTISSGNNSATGAGTPQRLSFSAPSMKSEPSPGVSAFGITPVSASPSPFSAAPSAPPSPFTHQSPAPAKLPGFGVTSSFGQIHQNGMASASSQSLTPSNTTVSPFGISQGTPGGMPSPAPTIKDPRQLLIQFYQQYNSDKIVEVDKLLAKYQGNYDVMFRNLAKKYNLNPSVFGLSAEDPAPSSFNSPVGFGQPSPLGGNLVFGGPAASPFGNKQGGFSQAPPVGANFNQTTGFGTSSASISGAAGFGSPTPLGSGGLFGQATTPSTGFGSKSSGFGLSAPTTSFGALASGSPGASPFGSFGGPSATPFGAPRR